MGRWLKRLVWRSIKLFDLIAVLGYRRQIRSDSKLPLLLDVGARGGPSGKWKAAHKLGLVDLCLVEPDSTAAAELSRNWSKATIIGCALGAHDGGQATLHICAEPGVSSLFEPNADALAGYGFAGAFHVVKRQSAQLRRFDALLAAGEARQPDFVKIDVQGYELEVLRGFGDALDRVIAVELEAQFMPLYRGQPLIGEIYAFMIAQGFGLAAIRPQSKFDKFNIVEANFFFARNAETLEGVQRRRLEFWCRLMRIPTSFDLTVATG